MDNAYKAGSLTLAGTVAMGTGVMIGAGIFALTGQVAEFAGSYFPFAFAVGAAISALSAYGYAKVAGANPSSGGIAMILSQAYGKGTITAGCAMLMALSMIINESLVARTFGTYTAQLFDVSNGGLLVSALALGLIIAAFLVNLAGNRLIGTASKVAAVLKIGGILVFAGAALWVADFAFEPISSSGAGSNSTAWGFMAGAALSILAYKGFTTITNSGGEVRDPHRNIGRAIAISLAIATFVYLLVAYAVGSNLSIPEIVAAKNYSLAEAARPGLGDWGLRFTVLIAIIATASGLLASLFAVSRMLTMLTDMKLIPHSHFGMPGRIQHHTLVYTVVIAGALAVFFDLSRIAAVGIIFYLVMDLAIQWGILTRLREQVGARAWIPALAIVTNATALVVFSVLKAQDDPLIIAVAIGGIASVFAFETIYLRLKPA